MAVVRQGFRAREDRVLAFQPVVAAKLTASDVHRRRSLRAEATTSHGGKPAGRPPATHPGAVMQIAKRTRRLVARAATALVLISGAVGVTAIVAEPAHAATICDQFGTT